MYAEVRLKMNMETKPVEMRHVSTLPFVLLRDPKSNRAIQGNLR